MEQVVPVVGLVLGVLLINGLASRSPVPPPILLLLAGFGVSFIPGVPPFAISPDLVLFVLLPPLLFAAALESSAIAIRRLIRPIFQLAVVLVLLTAFTVAVTVTAVLPGVPFAVALALGAIVAPPDAVAAVAVARTRPPDPPDDYRAWRSHLTHRTTSVRHDALTHAGLGHHTARVHQALTTTATDVLDLVGRTGYTRSRLSRFLDRLATYRLARTDRRGRWRLTGRTHTGGTRLGRIARTLGVLGVLAARACRYRLERQAWAWWTDELAWRRATSAGKRRAPGAGQLALVGAGRPGPREHHGQHPVDHRGRADYAAALAHLAQTAGSRRRAS